MPYLRNSILATLAYYDTLDFPQTLLEVYKYLINPGRLVKLSKGVGEITLNDIHKKLKSLTKVGLIGQKNGFYFLANREDLYDIRIERDKISSQKWKKFLRLSKWLTATPYIRGIFASGSMAINNTDKESDFDVLVVAKHGRLYTCRIFLLMLTSLLGARRKRFEKISPDKFCFNHYITDNNFRLKHESLFNAQTYINLKPVIADSIFVEKFYAANLWLNNFAYNFKPQSEFTRRSIKPNPILKSVAKMLVFIFDSPFGNLLEKILKKYQQNRIKKNPLTYEPGGRVIFNDSELEFHPRSFERVVLNKYKENLRKLAIVPYIEEIDSGLIPTP